MDFKMPLFSFSLIVYIFDYTAEPLGWPPRDGRPNLGNALHIRPDPVPFPQITCGLLSADHRLSAFFNFFCGSVFAQFLFGRKTTSFQGKKNIVLLLESA